MGYRPAPAPISSAADRLRGAPCAFAVDALAKTNDTANAIEPSVRQACCMITSKIAHEPNHVTTGTTRTNHRIVPVCSIPRCALLGYAYSRCFERLHEVRQTALRHAAQFALFRDQLTTQLRDQLTLRARHREGGVEYAAKHPVRPLKRMSGPADCHKSTRQAQRNTIENCAE